MRILVCGGRDYDDWDCLDDNLWNIVEDIEDSNLSWRNITVITGDAIGADWLARAWAKSYDCNYKGYPADWKTHGKAAGPIRNQRMLDEGKPDLVVAFPGGKGTQDMINRALKAGVKVIEP